MAQPLAGHVTVEDFADDWRVFTSAPVLTGIGRYAYIGRFDGDYPGCAARFPKTRTERETKSFCINALGLERKGFHRSVAGIEACPIVARAGEAEYLAGAGGNAEIAGRFRRRAGIDQVIESAERGIVK